MPQLQIFFVDIHVFFQHRKLIHSSFILFSIPNYLRIWLFLYTSQWISLKSVKWYEKKELVNYPMVSVLKIKIIIAKLLQYHQTLKWTNNDLKQLKLLYFLRFNTRQQYLAIKTLKTDYAHSHSVVTSVSMFLCCMLYFSFLHMCISENMCYGPLVGMLHLKK